MEDVGLGFRVEEFVFRFSGGKFGFVVFRVSGLGGQVQG